MVDKLRKLVKDNGWLTIREVLFQEGVAMNPNMTDGCVVMDNDNLYYTTSSAWQDVERQQTPYYREPGTPIILNYMYNLRVIPLSRMVNFDMMIFTRADGTVKGQLNPPYNFLSPGPAQRVLLDTRIPSVRDRNAELAEDEYVIARAGTFKGTETLAYDMKDGYFLDKAYVDAFLEAQEQFKQFLVAHFDCNYADLV